MTAQHDRAVRLAACWTVWSFLAFWLFYFFAALFFASYYDIGELCNLTYDQTYDPETSVRDASFPMRATCNAEFSLMPTWVNPTIVGIGAVFLISLALLIAASIRRQRALPPTP
jgi:hypothetical protein